MPVAVKLSSPPTGEFWEIPVLFNDGHLLALNKPAGLLVSPDRNNAARPSLMHLLHRGIERRAPWAEQLGLGYLMNTHRLERETSGIILLAKDKPALVGLAAQFATEQPCWTYTALAQGSSAEDKFETAAKLAPHPLQMGIIRVDTRNGKRSRTAFTVSERFKGCLLLECRPHPCRPYQISAHLKYLHLPLVGAEAYGGRPLLLSKLKPGYRLKPNQTERPLIALAALHAGRVDFVHPSTGEKVTITAPWPKDVEVSIKYLRRYAA